MAIKKTVIVDVKGQGLDELDNDIRKVEGSLKDVKSEAGNASGGLEEVGKNGGAIAVLDSLTGGLATKIRDAAEATKLFNFSLKGMKTALIATGIGALVVAVGLIVAYWDDIKRLVGGTTDNIEAQNKALEDSISIIGEKLKRLELEKKANEGNEEALARIALKEKGLLRDRIDSINKQIISAKADLEKEKSLARQTSWWGIILGFSEEQRKISDEEKSALKEQELALEQLITLKAELEAPVVVVDPPEEPTKKKDQVRETLETVSTLDPAARAKEASQLELDAQIQADVDKAIARGEARQAERDAQKSMQEWEIQNAKETADAKAALDADVLAAKYEGLDILANIFGAESDLGKAALVAKQAIALQELLINIGAIKSKATRTVAEASMDGAKASSSVSTGLAATLALGFPAAIPALVGYAGAAVGIVAGVLSAVKGAKSVASSYGGGAGSSAPEVLSLTPQFNVVGQSETNQLAQSISGQETPVIKAIVVSTDMTTQQELDRTIEESATF